MSVYKCRRCQHSADEIWEGTCPGCGRLYRIIKTGADTVEQKERSSFAKAAESTKEYIQTGVEGFDSIIGGGVVPGSVILFGGRRGTGKTTMLVMIADSLAKRRKTAYASSEETAADIVNVAHRVGARNEDVLVLGSQTEIEKTIATVRHERVFLTIYDSLQNFTSSNTEYVGPAAQGVAVAKAIMQDCEKRNACAILTNQVTRGGELRGGTDVEHAVKTILALTYPQPPDDDAPGYEDEGIRVLFVDGKNRNGPAHLKSYWRMNGDGSFEHVRGKSKIVDLASRRRKD